MKRIIPFLLFIVFFLSGHTQNTFPATGNVGIGTLTPGIFALNILGSNTDGGLTNSPAISISNSSTFLPAGNGYNVSWLNVNAGNNAVQAQLVTNYGVGTAAPFTGGSGFYIATRTNHPIIFSTGASSTEKIRIDANGNLCINTQTGIEKLTIVGNALVDKYRLNNITTPMAGAGIFAPASATFAVYTNSAEQLRVDANGHVGIGTININDVNYRLFVETGIRTRMIKVDATAWPDYVFESSYKLLPLNELKSYIKENKHLPAIPSETEVEKDGIDLGANQAKLLKKIEELTLYIIQLESRMTNMQTQMDQLSRNTTKK